MSEKEKEELEIKKKDLELKISKFFEGES